MSWWHLSVDVCTPPEVQSGSIKTELLFLPGKEISCPWPLLQYWELCGVPSSDCKEPGCDTGWPAVLRCQHCCDKLLLQILSPQHQEDISITHPEGSAGSGPGSCHLPPRLLKLAPGWCSCMYLPTTAVHAEYSSLAGLQPAQVLPCYATPPLTTLATSDCPNPI